MIFPLQWISAALLITCLASFSWAMQKFFVQPAGLTPGMKIIKAFGVVFGIIHLIAIIETPAVSPVRQIVGGSVVYLCALGLFWWAIRASMTKPLSAAFSPDLPVHMVAHGPYKIIRHPLYCSYLLCWLAGWVATARLWLAPTVVVMLVIYLRAAAQEEEKFRQSPLADAYRQYRARTGLFFPNPFKIFSGGENRLPETAA